MVDTISVAAWFEQIAPNSRPRSAQLGCSCDTETPRGRWNWNMKGYKEKAMFHLKSLISSNSVGQIALVELYLKIYLKI